MDPHHRPVDDRPPLSHLARVIRGPSLCSRHVRCRDPGGPTGESALLGAAVDDEVLFEVVRHRAGCRMMSLRARGNGGAQKRHCQSAEGDLVSAQAKRLEPGPGGHVGFRFGKSRQPEALPWDRRDGRASPYFPTASHVSEGRIVFKGPPHRPLKKRARLAGIQPSSMSSFFHDIPSNSHKLVSRG